MENIQVEVEDLTRDGPATKVINNTSLFMNKDLSTQQCIDLANQRLREEESTLARVKIFDQADITAFVVLQSMLKRAPTETGKRFCACAIHGASKMSTRESNGLVELAHDWVNHVLIPFRSASKNKDDPSSNTSPPTVDKPNAAEFRANKFREDLFARDNKECAMIRRRAPAPVPLSDDELESDIPAPYKTRGSKMNINACHIIKRSLAVQEKGSNSIFLMWNILRYYGELSEDILANLENVIDSPANGILLEKTLHCSFDNFEVVFLPQKHEANTYKIGWIDEPHLFYALSGRKKVTFNDHTGGLHPLPNSKFLAIHRAIAQVLHDTKLGEYLDMLMDQFIPWYEYRDVRFHVPAQKFDGRDIALRASITKLAGGRTHYLPEQGLDGQTLPEYQALIRPIRWMNRGFGIQL